MLFVGFALRKMPMRMMRSMDDFILGRSYHRRSKSKVFSCAPLRCVRVAHLIHMTPLNSTHPQDGVKTIYWCQNDRRGTPVPPDKGGIPGNLI